MNRPSKLLVLSLATLASAFDPPAIFPVSTRQALAQKSQQLNTGKQYSTAGWSNRAGTVLTPVATEGVYTADRPFLWNDIDVGCRCTVIEMPSKTSGKPDLWVHSPVGLDGPLQSVLNDLGNVKFVVSPNYEHVKFASQWHATYPEAQMWGNPGLAERLPNIKFAGEVPDHYRPVTWTGVAKNDDDKANLGWDSDVIQALHLDCEVNPFTGRAFFNEVVFYHAPTKTLLTTDLFWNYPAANGVTNAQLGRDDSWELAPTVEAVPFGSVAWKFGMDQVYKAFWDNFMIQNREAYQDIAHHILNVWDVETVIPAHGDILRGKEFIATVLKSHFRVET